MRKPFYDNIMTRNGTQSQYSEYDFFIQALDKTGEDYSIYDSYDAWQTRSTDERVEEPFKDWDIVVVLNKTNTNYFFANDDLLGSAVLNWGE